MPKRFYKTLSDIHRSNAGATAVEFALVVPLLGMLVFGMVELGVFYLGMHKAQQVSEDSAREVRMMNMPDKTAVETVLANHLVTPIKGSYVPVVTMVDQYGKSFADIRITYSYNLSIPFLDQFQFTSKSGTRVQLRSF